MSYCLFAQGLSGQLRAKAPPIASIQVQTLPGFIARPDFYTATISDGGQMRFYGSKWDEHPGPWTARVPSVEFEHLAECVDMLGFANLAPNYTRGMTDGPTTIITVNRVGDFSKSVRDYAHSAPSGMWAVEVLVQSLVNDANSWRKSK